MSIGMHRTNNSISARARLLVLLLITVSSCDGRGNPSSSSDVSATRRDSAGIEIIEVPGQLLDSLPNWQFASEPVTSVGEVAGTAPYNFQMIAAARRLSSGEIMITDRSLELRIFGPDGVFRRSYGRRGPGPGEFGGYPVNISETDGRRVAIYDRPRSNVTSMDLETGEFTTQPLSTDCREPGETEPQRCAIVRLLPNGTVFASRTVLPSPDSARASATAASDEDPRLTVRRFPSRSYGLLGDATFRALDTVRAPGIVQSGVGSDFFSAEALFDPGGQIAFGADGFITGDPRTFEIRVRGADGSLRRIIRVLSEAQPVTNELLGRHRRWADSAPRAPIAREYLATLRPGGTVPFFGSLRVDRAGRIWIRDYQSPSFWGPTSAAVWTILNSDGTPVARFTASRRGGILEAGEDYVLLLETNSDGVEFVRMYRLESVAK